MNWIKSIFGGGRKKKSSSQSRSKNSKNSSKNKSKSRSRAGKKRSLRARGGSSRKRKNSATDSNSTMESSGSKRNKLFKRESSGQTFSNAFSLAQRELPGIREADAAFQSQIRRRHEHEDDTGSVSMGQVGGSSPSPGIRRPN